MLVVVVLSACETGLGQLNHGDELNELSILPPTGEDWFIVAPPSGLGSVSSRATISTMVPGRFRWLTLALLAAWLLLGPVGMAFDSCAAIMALSLCDGSPCGVVSAVVETPHSLIGPAALSVATTPRREYPAAVVQSAVEPPPKPVRLSA